MSIILGSSKKKAIATAFSVYQCWQPGKSWTCFDKYSEPLDHLLRSWMDVGY